MTTHRDFFKAMIPLLGFPARLSAVRALAVVSIYESPQGDNHWNNPLACALYWEGATPYNTFGDGEHVWRYLTPADGEAATASRLGDPHWDGVRHAMRHSATRGPILDAISAAYTWAHIDFRNTAYNNYSAIHHRLSHPLQPYAPKDPWQ